MALYCQDACSSVGVSNMGAPKKRAPLRRLVLAGPVLTRGSPSHAHVEGGSLGRRALAVKGQTVGLADGGADLLDRPLRLVIPVGDGDRFRALPRLGESLTDEPLGEVDGSPAARRADRALHRAAQAET